MKDLALGGQMNAYLLWTRRTVMDSPRQQGWCNMHSCLQRFSVQCRTHSLLYMGETHTVVIDGHCDCEQSQPIRWRVSCVLLPPRMSNRGIWTRSRVCFGPGIFHVRSPGNPKENVSCSQLCTAPIVLHVPHWSK